MAGSGAVGAFGGVGGFGANFQKLFVGMKSVEPWEIV
jgi:hypothetical protein